MFPFRGNGLSCRAESFKEEIEIKHGTKFSNIKTLFFYQLLLSILIFCCTGCINTLIDPAQGFRVTAGPPRQIIQNDLPIQLAWSRSLTNGRPNVNLPLACYHDRGSVISWQPDQEDWQGTALFDNRGQILWNHSGDQARSITLDEDAVYIFDAPKLRAYEINSGELLWETEEGVGYRLSAYLFVEGDELHFESDKLVNIYQKDTGQMLSSEKVPSENLVLRDENIDFHSGGNLYATDVNAPRAILWVSEAYSTRKFLPQFYDDSLLVQSAPIPGNNNICRVSVVDGRIIWCENKRLLSNIAVHNDVGYGVNRQDELIGFRLADGVDVGKIIFRPEGMHKPKLQYHIVACEDHLLLYFASPEELFWFDFVE